MERFTKESLHERLSDLAFELGQIDPGLTYVVLTGVHVHLPNWEDDDIKVLLLSTSYSGVIREDVKFLTSVLMKGDYPFLLMQYPLSWLAESKGYLKYDFDRGIQIPIPHSA